MYIPVAFFQNQDKVSEYGEHGLFSTFSFKEYYNILYRSYRMSQKCSQASRVPFSPLRNSFLYQPNMLNKCELTLEKSSFYSFFLNFPTLSWWGPQESCSNFFSNSPTLMLSEVSLRKLSEEGDWWCWPRFATDLWNQKEVVKVTFIQRW